MLGGVGDNKNVNGNMILYKQLLLAFSYIKCIYSYSFISTKSFKLEVPLFIEELTSISIGTNIFYIMLHYIQQLMNNHNEYSLHQNINHLDIEKQNKPNRNKPRNECSMMDVEKFH